MDQNAIPRDNPDHHGPKQFAVFLAIGLAILGGAPGWLLILMIGVGAAALRIGNWWLPVLTHRYMNKEQA